MKKFRMTAFWTYSGEIVVEAKDWQEALIKGYDEPTPEGEYLDDSFDIDHGSVEEVIDE